jgi:uncharacterized OB-fold protein
VKLTPQKKYREKKNADGKCGYCGRRKLYRSGRCKHCYEKVREARRVRYWKKLLEAATPRED